MNYDGRDAFIYEMLGVSAMECVDPVDRELYYSLQREFAHGKK